MTTNAAASGQFSIGGDLRVNRLGFGAMRVTGKGIWGQPRDPAAARETLRKLVELGVDFIDTADAYGPHVSEELLREVLRPYRGLVIATKGGLERPGPEQWVSNGRPTHLRQAVEGSLRRLGTERIDLWQLHRIDSKVPRDEQFDAIAQMQKAGLIRHVGLSEVSIEELEAAQRYMKIATVQNRYNLVDRQSEDLLAYCEQKSIGFIPWYPLAAGALASPDGALATVAKRLAATPSQVALAWTLHKSPVMLPIPGTGNPSHLVENVAAAALALSKDNLTALEHQARA